MTSDGRPLCGYVEGIDGLFALVAHPGVILAPFLGRRCAQSVLVAWGGQWPSAEPGRWHAAQGFP